MLLELKVANFAIIDNVHIAFRNGLNILSGETGAGKSILLKSLGLLMGDKAATESVRNGAEFATIEGSFDLSTRPDIRERLTQMGIDAQEDHMVVRRVVAGGPGSNKSRVYINGALSTLSSLRDVVAPMVELTGAAVPLIEMTGQHENRNLQMRSYHLDLLDQFANVWRLRSEFADDFARAQQIKAEIDNVRSLARTRAQRLDFLVYQRDEIRALGLRPGEEEEIENETRRLKHSSRLSEFASQVEKILYNDDDCVTSRLHYLLQRAGELKKLDPALAEKLEPLSQARLLINEIRFELRDYLKELDSEPGRLNELEERLSALRVLQKKYGATANEILHSLATIEAEIGDLENSDENLVRLEAELDALERDLLVRAQAIHKMRNDAATAMADAVNTELKDLNMKGVHFRVEVREQNELSSTGLDVVEFMTQSASTEPARPLAKVASGGELSRILLAVKQVVGAGQFPRTYLFDEVDAGVSGPTAEKVGRKLKRIAEGQQVICVTHLPQVASFGDAHFLIHKKAGKKNQPPETAVSELANQDRVQEIARLISGEKITSTSLAHAAQLLTESARPRSESAQRRNAESTAH